MQPQGPSGVQGTGCCSARSTGYAGAISWGAGSRPLHRLLLGLHTVEDSERPLITCPSSSRADLKSCLSWCPSYSCFCTISFMMAVLKAT